MSTITLVPKNLSISTESYIETKIISTLKNSQNIIQNEDNNNNKHNITKRRNHILISKSKLYNNKNNNYNENDNLQKHNKKSRSISRIGSMLNINNCQIFNIMMIIYLLLCLLSICTVGGLLIGCPPVNLIHRLALPNGVPQSSSSSLSMPAESSSLFVSAGEHHNHVRHHNHTTPECDCTTIQEGGWEINCYANQANDLLNDYDATGSSSSSLSSSSSSSSSSSANDKNAEFGDYSNTFNFLMISFTVRYVVGRQVSITCDHGSPAFKPALFQGFGIEAIDTFVISNCIFPSKLPLSLILQRTITETPMSSSSSQPLAAYSAPPLSTVATSHFTFKMGNSEFSVNNTAPVAIFSPSRPVALSQTSGFSSSSPSSSSLSTQEFQETISPIRSLHLTSKSRVQVQQLNTLLSGLDSLEQLTLTDFDISDIDKYILNWSPPPPPSSSSSSSSFSEGSSSDSLSGPDFPSVETNERSKRDINRKFSEITTTENPDILSSTSEPVTMMPNILSKVESSKPRASFVSNSTLKTNSTFMEALPNKNREERLLPLPDVDLTFHPKVENGNDDNSDSVQPTTISPDFVISDLTEGSMSEMKDDEKEDSEPVQLQPTLNENALNLARLMPNLKILRLKTFIRDDSLPPVLMDILKNLTKLEYLELESNRISEIRNNSLSFAGRLRKLYLYNDHIKNIQPDAFHNLTSLEILDLSQNLLTELPETVFEPLPNLVHIGLRRNEILALKPKLFRNNSNLKSMDFGMNFHLEILPPELFDGLTSLNNLSFSYCNMSTVSADFGRLLRSIPKLEKLDLKSNRLTNLTIPGLFASNPSLRRLDLSNNQIRIIAPSIFSLKNSTKLESLNLQRNRINSLPETMFESTRNLKFLHLSQNELEEIHPMWFINLRSLEELYISRNRLTTLNSNVNQLPFGVGSSLRIVDLSYNKLSKYEEDIQTINWSLHLTIAEVNLRENQYSGTLTIPSFSSTLEPTVLLDVGLNRFTHVSTQNLHKFSEEDWKPLTANSYVTNVKIDGNPLNCDCFLYPFINYVQKEHLQHERVTRIRTIFDMTPPKPVCHEPAELKDIELTELSQEQLKCNIDDVRICPEQCKCQFRAKDSTALVDCDGQEFKHIPDGYFDVGEYYNISVIEIGGAIISDVKAVELSFKNNSISDVSPLTRMLSWDKKNRAHMPANVSFYLDYNNITALPTGFLQKDTSTDSPTLRRLSLTGNSIEKVPIEFLDSFVRFNDPGMRMVIQGSGNSTQVHTESQAPLLGQLFLGSNPINCYNEPSLPEDSCWVRDFKNFIVSHPLWIADPEAIKCTNISSYGLPENVTKIDDILINISDHILCPVLIPDSNSTALIALSVACVALGSSLFVVSVLYYRNKQTILAFIYIHFNPVFVCLSFSEDDIDEDKIYDAFVSYSSADRDIVMQLIEKLEVPKDMSEMNALMTNGKTVHEAAVDRVVPEYEYRSTLKSGKDIELGNARQNDPANYKLCIHERDWLPGNLISWNIVNSVQNSRRTILILSEQFIQSIWFQVEFHTAYYQMLEDKMDRLIVIVRGELPPKERLDKDLLYLLTTKTYLVWGEKWFWEKLYYALPHKRKSKGAAEFGKNARALEHNNFALTNGTPQKYGALNGKWKNGNGNRSEIMKDYVDQTIATHFQLNELSSGIIGNGNGNRNSSQRGMATTTPQYVQPEAGGHVDSTEPVRSAPKSLRNSGTLANASPATLQAFSASGAYDNKSFIDETGT